MIEIIYDLAEMQSLVIVWNELAHRSKNPLLRHEWFAACAEAFYEAAQLRIVINKSHEGIDAIAPLALVKERGVEALEIMGTSYHGEPSGLICKDRESFEELIRGILQMRKPVFLSRLRAKDPEVAVLKNISGRNSSVKLKDCAGSPFLPIAGLWGEFQNNLSSRRRYDLRRAQKRAENLGNVEFEILCPQTETLDIYLREIFLVEAAGWKGRKGTAILIDKKLRHFFQLYSKAACTLGTLRLCFLRIDSKPIAVMLAVECFDRFWVLKVGYDEAFSRCSPGILLMHETIRYAFKRGLEAYEFLGHDAPWIHIWAGQQHSYVTARIYPSSLSGQFRLGIDQTIALGGKMLKMVRK